MWENSERLAERLAVLHNAPPLVFACVCVCVSGGEGGLALNTSTHTKVNGMTHGDLYVRMPSRSSAKTLLNREKERKKKGAAMQPVWVST